MIHLTPLDDDWSSDIDPSTIFDQLFGLIGRLRGGGVKFVSLLRQMMSESVPLVMATPPRSAMTSLMEQNDTTDSPTYSASDSPIISSSLVTEPTPLAFPPEPWPSVASPSGPEAVPSWGPFTIHGPVPGGLPPTEKFVVGSVW